jgi:hypothetical protein
MTNAGPQAGANNPPPVGPGCLTLFGLGIATMVAGWLFAIAVYTLLVEQWGLITVRREFSLDMALLWAPLFGIAVALAVTFFFGRRSSPKSRAVAALLVALAVATGLLLLFFGLGAIF